MRKKILKEQVENIAEESSLYKYNGSDSGSNSQVDAELQSALEAEISDAKLQELMRKPLLRKLFGAEHYQEKPLVYAVAKLIQTYPEFQEANLKQGVATRAGGELAGIPLEKILSYFIIREEVTTSSAPEEVQRYYELLTLRADWLEAALEETLYELERLKPFL